LAEEKQKLQKKQEKKERTLLQKIVNVFLYTGLVIFIILLIAFAFSQTSTFRNWLKDTVVSTANDALNGKIYIGELDGTIFTSLVLRNTNVTMGRDTLLKAEKIEIRTSPLQILLKKIYVRKIEIDNTEINLVKEKDGQLNVSRLIPPSQTEDTTSSKFPFQIIVAELQINHTDFSLKNYNINTSSSYENINLNDFKVKDINLALSAFADINKNNFEFAIKNLSLNTNIDRFNLKKFSGEFYIDNDNLETRNLHLKTDSSYLTINAAVHNFSIFDTTKNTDFSKADINLDISADKFAFSDLSSFVPATDILQGTISTNIKTSGSLKSLNLSRLEVNFKNTHLLTKGKLENIDAGQNMQIYADLNNTYINQQDVSELLPSLKIPLYKDYGVIKFDTLIYKGKPLDFNFNVNMKTDKGIVAVDGNLNLEKEPLTYDFIFKTSNFDISPIAGIPSNITSHGSIKGMGVSPDSLNASVRFFAGGSEIDGNRMDTLKLIADAKLKNINYKLTAKSDTSLASLSGSFDFSNSKHPSYELDGEIRNLNLERITLDTTLQTNLNFSISASGTDFNPDSMNLFLSTTMYNSSVNGISIDSTRAVVDLRNNDGGERVVNIISDLADITLTGNFTFSDVADLVTNETKIVSNAVTEKLKKLLPSSPGIDSLNNFSENIPAVSSNNYNTKIDYVVEFKNFELLSLFLGGKQLELDGYVQGTLTRSADSLNFIFKSNLDYLKYWGKKDAFFLSKLDLNFDLHNKLDSVSLSGVNADVALNIERVFTGNDINDLHLVLNLKRDTAAIEFSGKVEDYISAKLNSKLKFGANGVDITFDTLSALYNNFDLINKKPVNLFYTPDKIEFRDFELYHKNGSIKIGGQLDREGNQDLTAVVKGITGEEISESLLGLKPEDAVQTYFNFTADIKGDFKSPEIKIKLNADSLTYKNRNFGSLIAALNYKNKNLNSDIRFIDSLRNIKKPKLKITGDFPLDLALTNVDKRIIENAPISIDVVTDSFKLGALGDVLPGINHIRGELTANLHIGGTINNFQPNGKLVFDHTLFVVEKNNIEYNAGLKLSINPDRLQIDSLLIKNVPNTKNGGQITGNGWAELKNMKIVSSYLYLNGQLKVLSQASKSSSPSVYGDLTIVTQGKIEFTMDNSRMFLKMPIDIKEANLTYPQTISSYQNTSNNFKYVFVEDSNRSQSKEADFQRLVDLTNSHKQAQQSNGSSISPFDYQIDVHVENEAKINFVLSKELDQNLVAILRGDFHYERENGRTDASGELNLLNGSTLEFIKTLDADGSIRFENELDNPYLDITATYTDYFTPAGDSTSSNEVKVAVKIKLKGFLKDLGKNLTQDQNNIAVYYGANNIENDTPDPSKSASDAVLFILAGRFTEGASQQDRNAAASTAASLAGSVIGGFLNKQLGDVVRRIEIRQVGASTRFNLIGKAGKWQYTIGGSTDVFQDLSQANVKVEYPLTNSLLIRVERKQSVTETNNNNINEMINELGLKYKFEF
jgi:hypothetical protein